MDWPGPSPSGRHSNWFPRSLALSLALSPTCLSVCGCVSESVVHWLLLLPSSCPSPSSSSSTRGAWRLAWEPSLKNTLLITPDFGARMVCCSHWEGKRKNSFIYSTSALLPHSTKEQNKQGPVSCFHVIIFTSDSRHLVIIFSLKH